MKNKTSQLVCAWAGVWTLVVMFIGLYPAHFLPTPYSPALSANELVALYKENLFGIRFCGVLNVFSAGLSIRRICADIAATHITESLNTILTPILLFSVGISDVLLDLNSELE